MGYSTNPDKGIVPIYLKQHILNVATYAIPPFTLTFPNVNDRNKMYHAMRAYLRGIDTTLPPSERIAHKIVIARKDNSLSIKVKAFLDVQMTTGEPDEY